MSGGAKATIGIGAVALLAGIVYFVTRKSAESEGGKKESNKALKKLMASKKSSATESLVNEEKV